MFNPSLPKTEFPFSPRKKSRLLGTRTKNPSIHISSFLFYPPSLSLQRKKHCFLLPIPFSSFPSPPFPPLTQYLSDPTPPPLSSSSPLFSPFSLHDFLLQREWKGRALGVPFGLSSFLWSRAYTGTWKSSSNSRDWGRGLERKEVVLVSPLTWSLCFLFSFSSFSSFLEPLSQFLSDNHPLYVSA